MSQVIVRNVIKELEKTLVASSGKVIPYNVTMKDHSNTQTSKQLNANERFASFFDTSFTNSEQDIRSYSDYASLLSSVRTLTGVYSEHGIGNHISMKERLHRDAARVGLQLPTTDVSQEK